MKLCVTNAIEENIIIKDVFKFFNTFIWCILSLTNKRTDDKMTYPLRQENEFNYKWKDTVRTIFRYSQEQKLKRLITVCFL